LHVSGNKHHGAGADLDGAKKVEKITAAKPLPDGARKKITAAKPLPDGA